MAGQWIIMEHCPHPHHLSIIVDSFPSNLKMMQYVPINVSLYNVTWYENPEDQSQQFVPYKLILL